MPGTLRHVASVSPTGPSNAQQDLKEFWANAMKQIEGLTSANVRVHRLPLKRIEKIIKSDTDANVAHVRKEIPVLFAKAAELFVHELSLRAWIHTEKNKRNTLQWDDIAMAIMDDEQFDFVVDLVPRIGPKATAIIGAEQEGQRNEIIHPGSSGQTLQLLQSGQTAQVQQTSQTLSQTSGGGQTVLQMGGALTFREALRQTAGIKFIQPGSGGPPQSVQGQTILQLGGAQAIQQGQRQSDGTHVLQKVVCPNGKEQNIPLQLSSSQIELIRKQLKSKQTLLTRRRTGTKK